MSLEDKPSVDSYEGQSPSSRLTLPDQKHFRPGKGLFREAEVKQASYGDTYYSAEHVAYKGGYSLEERRKKYADALTNISRTLPGKILDIGCGPGHFVAILSEPPYSRDVSGIDYSAVATQFLSEAEAKGKIVQGSVTDLPYSIQTFDSAYSFHTLEHLTEQQIQSAVAEISRVVKKKLYLIIPTWGPAIESDPELFAQIVSDPTHRVIASRDWWTQQFETYGWKENSQESDAFDRLKRGWVFVLERD